MMSYDSSFSHGMAASTTLQHEQHQQQHQQQGPPPPPPEEAGHEEQQQVVSSSSSLTNQSATMMDALNHHPRSVATLSQAWEYDDMYSNCYGCSVKFNLLERKHHCRYCGKIFCHNCSKDKVLIPPSAIVLVPKGGKQVTSKQAQQLLSSGMMSFAPDDDPDRMLTYVASGGAGGGGSSSNAGDYYNSSSQQQQHQGGGGGGGEVLLYGKGLEERFQLAREPLRVCRSCHGTLQPLQAELQRSNSHAMRFNHIDPTDVRRLFNSPLAFTLGHEVRKAAYTLSNLLPQPKRRLGATVDVDNFAYTGTPPGIHQECQDKCSTMTPTLSQIDGMTIPAKLLEQARAIAVLTVVKGGFGLAGAEFGTGLVVARLGGPGSNSWSAPSAIGTAGLSWGALLGAQVSDHVFVCMTDEAVQMLMSSKGSVQLGADVGVAAGPVGRAVEADYGASPHHVAPIYTYSLSKGLYAGVSLNGKVIVTRHNVNEKFYGRKVSPEEILQGMIPTPPAAQPLYDALTRCQVYTQPSFHARRSMARQQQQQSLGMEYGEWEQQPGLIRGVNQLNPLVYDDRGVFGLASSGMPISTNGMTAVSPVPYGNVATLDSQPLQPQLVFQPTTMPLQQEPMSPMPQQPPPLSPSAANTLIPQPTFARLPPLVTEQNCNAPAPNHAHSCSGLSDITFDPGY
jgi:SH3 domain-containing YSC84-like protein 1